MTSEAKTPITNEQRKAIQQDELGLLKNAQLNGEQEMFDGKNGYKFPETEKHHIHILVKRKMHNAAKKRYDEVKKVIKMHVKNYQIQDIAGAFNVWDEVKIIHDPRSEAEIKAHLAAVDKARTKRAGGEKSKA